MDCSVCSTMPFILRPPRNTICGACYEATKTIITLMNKFETDHHKDFDKPTPSPISSKPQQLVNVSKWMNNMKDAEDKLNEKIKFLDNIDLFKEQILTDIQLKSGTDDNQPSISAHRAILAARSEIFKNMLDSDSCKAPANDTITLPELNHEELESLLEFLYTGNLAPHKLEKHVYSLTLAADKYEIPYLLKYCQQHMLTSLDISNALDVLEISDVCSNTTLKESALNFVIKNMEDVVFTSKYEAFVSKNAHLAVHLTRALLMDAKAKRINGN